MNKQTKALKMAIEYLTNIQLDYKGHEVRKACQEALEDISKMETTSQPAQEVGDAEIKQMLNDIEYYKNRLAKHEDVL